MRCETRSEVSSSLRTKNFVGKKKVRLSGTGNESEEGILSLLICLTKQNNAEKAREGVFVEDNEV